MKCPHCSNPIEIVATEPDVEVVVCPSCGSDLSDADQTMVQVRPTAKSLGRFDLIEIIGRGYFGEVWLAEDKELHRKVAVKIPRIEGMDEDSVSRFLREAKAAASLNHPNIVAVHEIGSHNGTAFIVSEFVGGSNLAELLRKRKFSPRESAELILIMAEALHYAHEAGIVHRDLKPGNILVDKEGKPYLVDFGLAKHEAGEITITVAGQILGTPSYMSPEQARGDGHLADRRSDVYSLGVVLYEVMTGCRPFRGSVRLLIDAIQNSDPDPPTKFQRALPRDLETICLKAMSKEPHKRYQTAREMADDLRRFLEGEPIVARPISPLEKFWRWGGRHPMTAVAGGASLLCVVMTGLLIWNWQPQPKAAAAVATAPVVPLQRASFSTIPPGATLKLYPLHPETGEPQSQKEIAPGIPTPFEWELPPGDYFVVAIPKESDAVPNPDEPRYTFHEVYRRVPGADAGLAGAYRHRRWTMNAKGVAEIPEISLPLETVTEGMAYFEGDDAFILGAESVPGVPPHRHPVASYFLDPEEFRVQDLLDAEPIHKRFAPYALQRMPMQPPDPESSVSFVSYEFAVVWAEMMGKRLPTEAEYEFAATNRGRQPFPSANDAEYQKNWMFTEQLSPRWDRLDTDPPVYGLYSNLAEWTCTWPVPYPAHQQAGLKPSSLLATERIVRGGSSSVIAGQPADADWLPGPRMRVKQQIETTTRGVGFRCVRSAKPGAMVGSP